MMRGRVAGFILFAQAALAPATAAPMSAGREAQHRCEVTNASRLPPASGGAETLCSEIERAIAAAAPTTHYSAKVAVLSATRLSALLIVNGHAVPEQNFAVMDAELNRNSIRRFAESIAAEVAKAAKE